MKKYLVFIFNLFPIFLFCKNIAVVTVVIGSSYYDATLPGILSKQKYCELHGYDFICFQETIDPTRQHAWQKIKAIQQTLEKYDWVFWSDADSIIMNNTIPLESFIDGYHSFYICYDNMSNVVNSGQFLIKNSGDSFEFLDLVYSKHEFLNHPWWENAAIIDVLNKGKFSRDFAKILPQRSMNSFAYEVCGGNSAACYQLGDFIVHFPSIRELPKLGQLMLAYYNQSLQSN